MTRTLIFRAYLFGVATRWVSVLDPGRALAKVPEPWRRWATVREVEAMKWPRRKR